MLQLDNPKWGDLEGGYRVPYNASIALKRFEKAESKADIDLVFKELWEELHHQGDVGSASYFSVPHIIRIAKEKGICDFNVFGLVSTIEIERHNNNPALPHEVSDDYLKALKRELPKLVALFIEREWDETLSTVILASLAVSKGQIELAKALLLMEDTDVLAEFLENY